MESSIGLIELIQYGTPVVLLGLIISNVRLNVVVNNLAESVRDMKNNVVWTDRYDERCDGVDRRFDRLEKQTNGKK